MKEAIQKAVEGGYGTMKSQAYCSFGNEIRNCLHTSDPLFWQAVGKSLGWGETIHCSGQCYGFIDDNDTTAPLWKYYWHEFIDHLSEGKDAESFFNELLTNK